MCQAHIVHCFALVWRVKPSEIPPDVSHYLEAAGASYVDHQIELTYDNWTAGIFQLLRAIETH